MSGAKLTKEVTRGDKEIFIRVQFKEWCVRVPSPASNQIVADPQAKKSKTRPMVDALPGYKATPSTVFGF